MERKLAYLGVALCLVILMLAGCGKEADNTEESVTETVEEAVTDYTALSDNELEVLAYDNDLEAQSTLANRYDYGTADKGQDFELAYQWYAKAAEAGSAEALTALGYMHLNGILGETDLDEAVSYFNQALEAGNTDAYIGIARAYLDGYSEYTEEELDNGTMDVLDTPSTVYLFVSKAYEEKTPLSLYYMAYCLETGTGTEQNATEALALYQKVLEEEDLSVYDAYLQDAAHTRIGIIYALGEGVDQDLEQAREAFSAAADDGYAMAQYYMGMLYENGLGVDKDYETAYDWYLKAAEANYAPALNQIGYLYYNGYGVDVDIDQTIYYQKLAAMQNYAAAQINLGYLFENGIGVEKNLSAALSYYQLAAEQDQEGAKEAVQRVRKLMNEEGEQ
jgi:hypothetical protein